MKIIKRDVGDSKEYERIVMCEMLIPDVPNVYGDIYTEHAIREFVTEFARQGHGLDVNHDNIDQTGQGLIVVESFIAREGDPLFIKGSWVIAMKVLNDALWQQVLDGTLNGFSYEAECWMTEIGVQNLRNRQIIGTTEPDLIDGHVHDYLVIVDALNRPISGGTGNTDGHSHTIASHTVTQPALSMYGAGEHAHRYQVVQHTNMESEAISV